MPQQPSTEHEWTVHALNIHGTFLERWCQEAIASAPGWRFDAANYPVEYPPPNGPLRGRESTLDVRASTDVSSGRVALLVECKKNNPEFVNWIFFPKPHAEETEFAVALCTNTSRQAPSVGWDVTSNRSSIQPIFTLTSDAREARSNYADYKRNDKTKTGNAAIQEAAYQIALATQAIIAEDYAVSQRLGNMSSPPNKPWNVKLYLPVILTTAHLQLCEFNPADVDARSGEIAYDKGTLREVPGLVYEYALPRHLQFGPLHYTKAYAEALVDTFTRMQIIVVQSEHFKQLLADIRGSDAPTITPQSSDA